MSVVTSFVSHLASIDAPEIRAFYQHIDSPPGTTNFAWCRRNGDERLETFDDTGEPDIIYFDVELYSNDLATLDTMIRQLRAMQDHRGQMGDGTVEDIRVEDQQDDYEPQASANTLPSFSAAFRVTVTLYEE